MRAGGTEAERAAHAETRSALEGERAAHAETRSALEAERAAHAERISSLRAALEAERASHAEARRLLEIVLTSTSWRVTAPLRDVSRRLKEHVTRARATPVRKRHTPVIVPGAAPATAAVLEVTGVSADEPLDPVNALIARVRDQSDALAGIEVRLRGASPVRSDDNEHAFAQPRTVLAGTHVAPRVDSQNDPPRLTVITSTYNKERYAADAIESIVAQRTTFPIQLIVSDDASTDSTPDIIETFRARYPELITVIRAEQNGGEFAAFLRAMALTQTDYFTVLDADDYWTDSTFLQEAVSFLDGHPDFVIYSANSLVEAPDGSRTSYIPADASDADFCFEDYVHKRAVCTHTTGTIFRNVFFKFGFPKKFADMLGPDDQYSFEGDVPRYLIHLEKGKARFVNHPVGVYRYTGDGLWSGLNRLEQCFRAARGRLAFWRYFGCHPEFFLGEALTWIDRCLEIMREPQAGWTPLGPGASADVHVTPQQVADVRTVVDGCRSHLASLAEMRRT